MVSNFWSALLFEEEIREDDFVQGDVYGGGYSPPQGSSVAFLPFIMLQLLSLLLLQLAVCVAGVGRATSFLQYYPNIDSIFVFLFFACICYSR